MLSFHATIDCRPLQSFPYFAFHHLTFLFSPLFLSHSCLSPRPLHIHHFSLPLYPLPSLSLPFSLPPSPGEHPFKAFAPGLFQELRANEGEREAHCPALYHIISVPYHICTAPYYAVLCCAVLYMHVFPCVCVCVCVCVDVTAAAPLVGHHSPVGTLDLLRFLPFLR